MCLVGEMKLSRFKMVGKEEKIYVERNGQRVEPLEVKKDKDGNLFIKMAKL